MHEKLREMNERLRNGKEPIYIISPKEIGYKDRGMKKWQGFLLSDHVEAMKKKKRQESFAHSKTQTKQTLNEVTSYLMKAYAEKKPVSIQMNYLENGQHDRFISGFIEGYNHNLIYIRENKKIAVVELEDIRYIRIMTMSEYEEIMIEE